MARAALHREIGGGDDERGSWIVWRRHDDLSLLPYVTQHMDAVLQRLRGINTKPLDASDKANHAPDFTSVNWYGDRYSFSKGNQAEAVRVLWDAWKKGGHGVGQETIGERIGSNAESFRLAHAFRKHPAWGTMIRSEGKGVYRLTPPES